MKTVTIITGFALLFAYETGAQNLLLRDNLGNNITNGDTIVVTGTTADFMLINIVLVYNPASTSKAVLVEKTHLYLVPGSDAYFAWGIDMYHWSVYLSTNSWQVNPGAIDSSFQAGYAINGFAGTSFIRYKFFDSSNTADSAWVVIQYFVQQAAGIEEENRVGEFMVYPNPAGNKLAIGNRQLANCIIEIYDFAGRKVFMQKGNSEKQIAIDVSTFLNGIYTLHLLDEMGATRRVKFIIAK